MLEEQLQAQHRAAIRFGLTDKQIEELQRATRFRRAEDFLRVGQKSQGLRLVMHNLRGAHFDRATTKILLRLVMPGSLMRAWARIRQRKAFRRYGTL